MRALPLIPILLVAASCTSVPGLRTDAPATVPVACSPGRLDVDCFRHASEVCGRAGYDLFDLQGRPATVSDAQYKVLEARCRR